MATGAVRDLWPAFSQHREKAFHGNYKTPSFTQGGLGDDGMEMTNRMEEGRLSAVQPDWMKYVDNVKKAIAELHQTLRQLGDAQSKQLKGGDNIFDVQGESDNKDEVEELNARVGKLFKNANSTVKLLTSPNVGTAEDAKVRKNIQMALAADLQELSTRFRKKHKEYIRTMQEIRSRVGNSFQFTPPEDEDDADADEGWTQQQLAEADNMGAMIDQRDEEITAIAKSVSELAQLFRELSVLVIDSGTILDRIDYNMEEVVVNFEAAEEELEKTEEIMKKGKSAYCILILMCMCVVMATILIIKKA